MGGSRKCSQTCHALPVANLLWPSGYPYICISLFVDHTYYPWQPIIFLNRRNSQMRVQDIATNFNHTIIAVNNITRLHATEMLLFMPIWWPSSIWCQGQVQQPGIEGMTRTEELDWLLLLLYRELLAASMLKGHQPASHNNGGGGWWPTAAADKMDQALLE